MLDRPSIGMDVVYRDGVDNYRTERIPPMSYSWSLVLICETLLGLLRNVGICRIDIEQRSLVR